jgi:ribonuclease BN (tRNA processing enzyme)
LRRLPCSSYLLESSDTAVLLDCGFGSFESLEALRPDVGLDALILSHAHPDHVADLALFLGTASLWRRAPRLIASRPTIDGASFDATTLGERSLDIVRDGDRVIGSGFGADFSSTRHQVPTLGVQVTMGGSRVVYSADTGPGWAFPASFRGADVAIVECTLDERSASSSPTHLDAHEVATLIGGLLPLMTLISHVPPGEGGERRRDIVRAGSQAQVVLARPGLTIEVGREGSL